jgi:hypothetical protein
MAATNDDIVAALSALTAQVERTNQLLSALTAEVKQSNEYLEHIQIDEAFRR